MTLQAVLVPRKYTLAKAKLLIRQKYGNWIKIHPTKHYFRFRILNPEPNASYFTKKNGQLLEVIKL
jgi:hypothetical protein